VVVVSYSGKEINAKLVYYGCGLSGKTTNLESIYEAVPESSRGKMVSMKTQSDRTLFFDLLPLDLGEIMGFKTRFLLYTVPGQVFYNATRKLVLKGGDAIVFVADSEVGKMEENKESLANLRANLAEYGLSLDNIPWVLQYNKRDLPNVYSIDELNAELNPDGKIPIFEAVAKDGKGVFETFRGISHLLMEKVTRDLRRTSGSTVAPPAPPARPAPAEDATESASPARPRPAGLSPAQAPREPARNMDYGREIELPGDFPAAAPPARAAGAASPAPAGPRTAPALRTPGAGTPRSEPGAGPAAETLPRRPGSAPPAESTVRKPFPAGPSREEPGNLAGPGARPGPSLTGPGLARSPAGTGGETSATSEELIVPIQVGANGTHEIVLRIVLKIGG
jgi:hypothetical protein